MIVRLTLVWVLAAVIHDALQMPSRFFKFLRVFDFVTAMARSQLTIKLELPKSNQLYFSCSRSTRIPTILRYFKKFYNKRYGQSLVSKIRHVAAPLSPPDHL